MSENKRYIDGGEECIVDQFLIDTETDEYFFIDSGLEKIIKRLNEQDKRIKSKERVIKAYEDYIKTLKEDGVLDD